MNQSEQTSLIVVNRSNKKHSVLSDLLNQMNPDERKQNILIIDDTVPNLFIDQSLTKFNHTSSTQQQLRKFHMNCRHIGATLLIPPPQSFMGHDWFWGPTMQQKYGSSIDYYFTLKNQDSAIESMDEKIVSKCNNSHH